MTKKQISHSWMLKLIYNGPTSSQEEEVGIEPPTPPLPHTHTHSDVVIRMDVFKRRWEPVFHRAGADKARACLNNRLRQPTHSALDDAQAAACAWEPTHSNAHREPSASPRRRRFRFESLLPCCAQPSDEWWEVSQYLSRALKKQNCLNYLLSWRRVGATHVSNTSGRRSGNAATTRDKSVSWRCSFFFFFLFCITLDSTSPTSPTVSVQPTLTPRG